MKASRLFGIAAGSCLDAVGFVWRNFAHNLGGAPITSEFRGINFRSVISDRDAIKQLLPIAALLRMVAPMPIRQSSPIMQPWSTA